MKTNCKQVRKRLRKPGRPKGKQVLAIDPHETLGGKLLKAVIGANWATEELQLARSILAAEHEYHRQCLLGPIVNEGDPLPTDEQRESRRAASKAARNTRERVGEELLMRSRQAILSFDSQFFYRLADAVRHCETLRRQPVDKRRYAFLCFVSQHLCPEGIAGTVTGIIRSAKTSSDVKEHFRKLKLQEPSEKELWRWQQDCGVILTREKPGRKTGSKNRHGGK
ncbi:MAG TPA: hypothetical protein VL171_00870 [Verrucomicrobiae bacterium]|nr:hypothetical protein [Verrucomicrobiae bacterium]